MLRNIQPLTRMVLSGFAVVLLASGCENPAADNRGSTGSVTLAKFNAIRVDRSGNTGMTPAEVIKVMGFEGERFETVSSDFSVSLMIVFRESARKRISVTFNENQRARSKGLEGIQLITLEKYQAIKTGAADGSTRADVNRIMGFDGLLLSSPTSIRPLTDYYWREGSFHYVRVTFNASGRAISKRLRGGFPGMITLAKYNRIVVGRTTGLTRTEIDGIMGFEGSWRRANSAALSVTYRWAESADRFVEVDILDVGSRRAVAARASGLPGAKAKP